MKKMLLAIDAENPDRNALEFACYTARLTRSAITGIFLEAPYHEDDNAEYMPANVAGAVAMPTDAACNIDSFKKYCEEQGIHCKVRRDGGVPAEEAIAESRFADMLIISASTSFLRQFEGLPTSFSKKAMHHAECPVIIAPESFYGVDEIIFCYDNSASSVFAVKQFTYLFPEYSEKKVIVLHVGDNGWQGEEKYVLNEWMSAHYTDVHYEVLEGSADSKLFDYIYKRKNHFTVMGAYGRTALSNFFKSSNADLLIKTTIQPIFIAHK